MSPGLHRTLKHFRVGLVVRCSTPQRGLLDDLPFQLFYPFPEFGYPLRAVLVDISPRLADLGRDALLAQRQVESRRWADILISQILTSNSFTFSSPHILRDTYRIESLFRLFFLYELFRFLLHLPLQPLHLLLENLRLLRLVFV